MQLVPFPLRGIAAAIGAFALLTSCASLLPFTPDRDAKAPGFSGFGSSDIAITSAIPAARRLFNEGVLQAYAFNEVEAVRQFKAALAVDPQCAMCAWGVAWQLGPNINDNSRDRTAEALKYVDYALRRLDGATPRERSLIEALAVRYAHASTAKETAPLTAAVCGQGKNDDKANPLDVAYAERMRKLADTYPLDADILSLYAEAEMIATEGDDLWDKAGKPAGRIGEVTTRVEKLLPARTQHTGLNHYLVHLTDAQPVAARAVAAADRLGLLAPLSPHLVHMPAHTYVHVGRYADATRVNQQAVASDVTLADSQKAQGFTVSKDWRGHNSHFLWYAAVMSGQEEAALAAAAGMEEQVAKDETTFAEYVRSLRLITLVRTERWDQLLQEPAPRGDKGIAEMFHQYARGVAQARLGKSADAAESLSRVQGATSRIRKDFPSDSGRHKNLRSMADFAESGLQAEIALAQGGWDASIEQQNKVVQALAKLDAREPPMFADGSRLALAHVQARAGRLTDAEAGYRQSLVEHPGSGWALRGLAKVLAAQGKRQEAEAVQRELARAWSQASPHLRAPA